MDVLAIILAEPNRNGTPTGGFGAHYRPLIKGYFAEFGIECTVVDFCTF